MIDLSIILVSYNTAELTKKAIDLVYASVHRLKVEIIVIDNASKDNSVSMIKANFPEVTLITNDKNVGFGRANNQALPIIKGRYVLLLNTDAFVQKDTLQKTIDYMDIHPETGVLGVKLIGSDEVLQPSCRYFPTVLNLFVQNSGLNKWLKSVKMVDDMTWNHESVRHCDWVPGCYYLIRKEVVDQVGLFDERYFLYCEEVDHCKAVKEAGWQVTYYPYTSVIHIGGESAKSDNKISSSSRQISALQVESELLYFRKNHGLLFVILHFFASIVTECLNVLRKLVKFSMFKDFFQPFKNIQVWIKLAWATRFGAVSLR